MTIDKAKAMSKNLRTDGNNQYLIVNSQYSMFKDKKGWEMIEKYK